MGSAHFLTRTLAHVSTEMSLHVLAYNLKRVMSVLGVAKTMKAMRLVARKRLFMTEQGVARSSTPIESNNGLLRSL